MNLKDQDANVRYRAAIELHLLGPKAKAAIPALVAALKDEKQEVRDNAAHALGEFGSAAKAGVPALVEMRPTLILGKPIGWAHFKLGNLKRLNSASAKPCVWTVHQRRTRNAWVMFTSGKAKRSQRARLGRKLSHSRSKQNL